ncbi:hypothetical protein [Helicobacter sp. 23-1045]
MGFMANLNANHLLIFFWNIYFIFLLDLCDLDCFGTSRLAMTKWGVVIRHCEQAK